MYKCPKCGSTEVGQYRMPTGAMWCEQCSYRVEDKNKHPNPFIKAAMKSAAQHDEPKNATESKSQ